MLLSAPASTSIGGDGDDGDGDDGGIGPNTISVMLVAFVTLRWQTLVVAIAAIRASCESQAADRSAERNKTIVRVEGSRYIYITETEDPNSILRDCLQKKEKREAGAAEQMSPTSSAHFTLHCSHILISQAPSLACTHAHSSRQTHQVQCLLL